MLVVVIAILVEPGVDYMSVVGQNSVVRDEDFGVGTGSFAVGAENFGVGTENSEDGTESSATDDVVPGAPAAPSHQANLGIFLPWY